MAATVSIEHANSFATAAWEADSIEAVADFMLPDASGMTKSGGDLIISRSLYKEMTVFSILMQSKNPQLASEIGALIGSHDEHIWIMRTKYSYPKEKEIQLCHLGLTVNPKSPGAYSHLKVLLQGTNDKELIYNEFKFCQRLTGRRPRNYLLWSYRSWLHTNFKIENDELEWTLNWISQHPSDSSAFSYLQCIMPKDEKTIISYFRENTKMIIDFPGHESLWMFRRYLMQLLKDKFVTYKKQTEEKEGSQDGAGITELLYRLSMAFGIKFMFFQELEPPSDPPIILENESLLTAIAGADNFAAEWESQKLCAERHGVWLSMVFS